MITGKLITEEWYAALDDMYTELLGLCALFSAKEFSASVAFFRWNAAQVCEHIHKTIDAIAGALSANGKATDRNPAERISEIKALFLNFDKKFQSPESVLPTKTMYTKEAFVEDLEKSIERVRKLSSSVNLFETIDVPGFGELTKLELFYFIIYHSQRHINQLRNLRMTGMN